MENLFNIKVIITTVFILSLIIEYYLSIKRTRRIIKLINYTSISEDASEITNYYNKYYYTNYKYSESEENDIINMSKVSMITNEYSYIENYFEKLLT